MNSATLADVIPGLVRGTSYVPHDCMRCPLSVGRTQVVPAEGAPRPLAFFVGEAPGPDEDRLGRPFVGRAGKILRQSLAETGWKPDEQWITNAVKCFPHTRLEDAKKIRAPTPEEVSACRVHIDHEIMALRPRLIIALGRTAATALLGAPEQGLDALHGQIIGKRHDVPVFATFHPSGLHYRKGRTEQFLVDLRQARAIATSVSP